MTTGLHIQIALLVLLSVASVVAQAQAVPRTPDGHPDLQGTWTNATLTPFERRAEFAGKATLTDEEAIAYEKKDHHLFEERPDLPAETLARIQAGNAIGAEESEAWETGTELTRVDGRKRTSLVVDPPDGKVPGLTPEAKRRAAERRKDRDRADSVKDLALKDRCMAFTPVPMVQQVYNNNYQIVQTPGAVMIMGEMIHDARIVRMNGPHAAAAVRQWLGDSVGHWEGDTLVIDTTNFRSEGAFRGSTGSLHVVERLSRASADTLLYRATIEDAATFTKPWTIEYTFRATADRIFEYACHEGNSWVESRLGAARAAEAAGGTGK